MLLLLWTIMRPLLRTTSLSDALGLIETSHANYTKKQLEPKHDKRAVAPTGGGPAGAPSGRLNFAPGKNKPI